MTKIFDRANELQESMLKDRRELHQMPEIGLELPKTKAYVKARMEEIGLEVQEYGSSGLGALIEGNGPGKTILLRGDMDALGMTEENDLDFRSTGETAHMCGHDLHAAALLGAAQILMENKDKFKGNVKLMFQPAEETFEGAKMMIEEGILENPKVDAAIAIHTNLDGEPGKFYYSEDYVSTSSDNFRIDVQGKGGHGAYPHTTKDPINAAVQIYQGFNYLLARENTPSETTTLTFGQLSAGAVSNIIPDKAVLQGTMRTFNPEIRERLKKRMQEIVDGVELTSDCEINLDFFTGTDAIYNDPQLLEEVLEIGAESLPEIEFLKGPKMMASEDMGFVSQAVPTVYMMANAKVAGNDYSHHNPRVLFNEDMMPYGAAFFATVATEWLNKY